MVTINPDIFKSYDIRAVYPIDLNEETLPAVIQVIYTFFTEKLKKEKITVALARDMRLSSPSMFAVATQALLDCGADVIDLGLLSTPSFYFAVSHYGYETGIQITASHNPKEYTGLKFVINSSSGLIKIGKPTGMEDIKKMVVAGQTYTGMTKGTLTKKEGILEDEVENSLAILRNPQIKPFTIVADTANAMGATFIDPLFKKIPGKLIRMNFELDGSFPVHEPNPLDFDTLKSLQKKVIDEKADFGIATDGDGDRLFFIDEKGSIIPPTLITSLVAKELLKEFPGENIFIDIRYILTPKKIIEENGGNMIITKVGHAFISEAMEKEGGIFAGESSGHYFFKATGNAEAQQPMILAVLKVMSEEGKPLSEIVETLRRSYESGEINFTVSNAKEIIELIKQSYKDGALDDRDGIAISYPDWRLSVRTSNTEPLLRLNVEAYEKPLMEEKKNELVAKIKSLAK